jgi:pyridinium-3,5-biscarboxylic acid mononucleotide sulfurtransferase
MTETVDLEKKYEELTQTLSQLGNMVVCFSGGVDSTLLLKAAVDTVGASHVLALIATSASYPEKEYRDAVSFVSQLNVPFQVLASTEMSDIDYLRNTPDRCYYCKRRLFADARKIADRHGFTCIVEGSNVDDTTDYRPGSRARMEAGIISPLLDAGLTKMEIRQLSRKLCLPTHNKPAMACLASRVPYGTPISPEILKQIEVAEDCLHTLGLIQVRVRHHGPVARIEVGEADFEKVFTERDRIVGAMKKAGFLYAALDLKGYRTGSMNEILVAGS